MKRSLRSIRASADSPGVGGRAAVGDGGGSSTWIAVSTTFRARPTKLHVARTTPAARSGVDKHPVETELDIGAHRELAGKAQQLGLPPRSRSPFMFDHRLRISASLRRLGTAGTGINRTTLLRALRVRHGTIAFSPACSASLSAPKASLV